MSADCGILHLPLELLIKILEYLEEPFCLTRVASTCSLLAVVAKHDLLWKPLVPNEFENVVKMYSDPAWGIRPGWEDLVELFAGLAIGHEDSDDPYFVSWFTAYKSESIWRRRVETVLDCERTSWQNGTRKTWRQIYEKEKKYRRWCRKDHPGEVKYSY